MAVPSDDRDVLLSPQNVYQFWVVLVFGAHMVCIMLLLRFVPAKAPRRAWAKLRATCTIKLCGCLSLRVPGFTDMSLLAACLLWPPACFVSDATDAQGLLCIPCCPRLLHQMCDHSLEP